MFDEIRDHEVEQRRRFIVYALIFLVAAILTIAAIVATYA